MAETERAWRDALAELWKRRSCPQVRAIVEDALEAAEEAAGELCGDSILAVADALVQAVEGGVTVETFYRNRTGQIVLVKAVPEIAGDEVRLRIEARYQRLRLRQMEVA